MTAQSSTRRFLKLAGMTANIAGKAVSRSLRTLGADEDAKLAARQKTLEDIGTQIADTLGQMKGAVMKVGQIASQYQDLFPPEVAKALGKLQRQAPPMPFEQIRKQVETELGQPLDRLFQSFEPTPFAAASIGQVHRATLPDGQPVVVKVQYPGVDECCESDLKQVRLALRLAGVLKIDRALQDRLFEEIRQSLQAELDYRQEAHNLQVFAAFHAPLDDRLVIPKVYPSHSSRRVLTLSEENGEPIETAATWPLAVRNQLAQRLFAMMGQEIFILNSFHCDPHPGNFAFREDGTVVVYDFGCTKALPPEVIQHYRQLVQASLQGNMPAVEEQLRALRVRTDAGQVPADFYQQWIDILLPPVNGRFDFAHSEVHKQAMQAARSALRYWDCFQPSADTMMLDRAISGHYWNMVALKAHTDFSDQVTLLTGATA